MVWRGVDITTEGRQQTSCNARRTVDLALDVRVNEAQQVVVGVLLLGGGLHRRLRLNVAI